MKIEVPNEVRGQRIDAWLAGYHPQHSRAQWQRLIKDGAVLVNNLPSKCGYILRGGEFLDITIPPPAASQQQPQDIPLAILHEDEDLIVINKPPGLVVHPAAGHADGTLVNALLFHCRDLAGIGGELRPGIVHRLDKDTSGVLIVAKNEAALAALTQQFKERSIRKEYLALVHGICEPRAGRIEAPIGRSQRDRKKMSISLSAGRYALTSYVTEKRFAQASLLRVVIATGRTHQIRVHLAHYGHPILGDTVYGRVARLGDIIFPRQMLHAERIVFHHPKHSEIELDLHAPLPADMQAVLTALAGADAS